MYRQILLEGFSKRSLCLISSICSVLISSFRIFKNYDRLPLNRQCPWRDWVHLGRQRQLRNREIPVGTSVVQQRIVDNVCIDRHHRLTWDNHIVAIDQRIFSVILRSEIIDYSGSPLVINCILPPLKYHPFSKRAIVSNRDERSA